MRKTLNIISAVIAILSLASCVNDEPAARLAVKLNADAVTVAYGSTAELGYTVSGNDGDVTVSFTGLPEGVTASGSFSGRGGTIAFASTVNADALFLVKAVFRDSHDSVTKEINMTTTAMPVPEFIVKTASRNVTITSAEPAEVPFSVEGTGSDVNAALSGDTEGVILGCTYDSMKRAGTLVFSMDSGESFRKDVTVTFTDGERSLNLVFKISASVSEVAPQAVRLDAGTLVLWPESSGLESGMGFTVEGGSSVDAVDVRCSKGVSAQVRMSDDGRSGTVVLAAEAGFSGETVTVVASNGAGEAAAELKLEEAYLTVTGGPFDVPEGGGEYDIKVKSNVEHSCTVKGGADFVSVKDVEGKTYRLSVAENPNWEDRAATVEITDGRGWFHETVTLAQEMTTGSPLSDKMALQAMYYALGGPTWPETGNGIDLVRNWEDLDAPLDNWLNIFPFYTGTKAGRVDEIHWTQNDLRKGVMPDDIGRLSHMREFVMLRSGVTNLPQGIGNLKEMIKFSVHDNPLNFRLDEHEGLKRMALASPRFHTLYLFNCGLTGSIPEWLGDLPQKVGGFQPLWGFDYNKLSGRVPDKVAAHSAWNWEQQVDVDGDGRNESITVGIKTMITQGGGRYALWVGEQPDNVRFVDDADGGHWEWIGENPYLTKEYPEVE